MSESYEAPTLTVIGSVEELTLNHGETELVIDEPKNGTKPF